MEKGIKLPYLYHFLSNISRLGSRFCVFRKHVEQGAAKGIAGYIYSGFPVTVSKRHLVYLPGTVGCCPFFQQGKGFCQGLKRNDRALEAKFTHAPCILA